MKILLLISGLVLCVFNHAYAADAAFKNLLGNPYAEVRQTLLNQGWRNVDNPNITQSSIYAQDIAQSGFTEVLDCISMQRDQCMFVLVKNQKYIIIVTKDKNLYVESIKYQKRLPANRSPAD